MRVKQLHEIHPQSIPELFLEIMKHDALEPLPPLVMSYGVRANAVVFARESWFEYRKRHANWRARKQELISEAEKFLCWNTDKGNLK